jgi:catechol 2,3-dioxygenase-like lactoylglutathione lyase family enzyme
MKGPRFESGRRLYEFAGKSLRALLFSSRSFGTRWNTGRSSRADSDLEQAVRRSGSAVCAGRPDFSGALGSPLVISPVLDHLDLVVSSLERTLPFYQELLGFTESGEIEGERGERVVHIAPPRSDPRRGRCSASARSSLTPTPSPRTAMRSASTMWPFVPTHPRRWTTAPSGSGREERSRAGPRNTTSTDPGTTPSSSTTPTGFTRVYEVVISRSS